MQRIICMACNYFIIYRISVCGFTISFILAIVAFVCTLVTLCPMIVMFKIASSLKNIEDVICYSKADKDVDELHYDEAKDSKYIELDK